MTAAAGLDIEPGDVIQDRFDPSKWRTVVSVTDARPGRVWVLYSDGTCPIEDVAWLLSLGDVA